MWGSEATLLFGIVEEVEVSNCHPFLERVSVPVFVAIAPCCAAGSMVTSQH